MTIKDIKAQLEKLKTTKEKLDFLERKLKETKDAELIKFIRQLIDELKQNDEKPSSKIESFPLLEQEIARFTSGFQPEEQRILPIRRSLDMDISNMQVPMKEEKQSSYGVDDYGMRQGASYDLASMHNIDTDSNLSSSLKDRFIREGIFTNERDITFEDRQSVRERIRSMLPGISEEKIITYESSIINDRQPAKIYQKKIT